MASSCRLSPVCPQSIDSQKGLCAGEDITTDGEKVNKSRRMPEKMRDMPEPWHKRPAETPMAYDAFIRYRDAGRERNVVKLAEKLGKHPNQIWTWMRKYDWKERALAWDNELDEQFKTGLVAERIKAAKETIELGRTIRGKAAQALVRMIERGDELAPEDIPRWAELGVRLERLALGDSSISIELKDEKSDDREHIKKIIDNPKARELALELDELLAESFTESDEPDDAR